MQPIRPDHITTDAVRYITKTGLQTAFDVLRLDKIHPHVSGNKWFKLRYYLEDALQDPQRPVLTFGGAWSNHLLATAAMCHQTGLNCTGIIRGGKPESLSKTLQEAGKRGMQFRFVPRDQYRKKIVPDDLAGHYAVPEGGYGPRGVKGAATILDYAEEKDYTHICCAAGTGTMTAGLIEAVTASTRIIGISVLKNHTGMENDIRLLLTGKNENWEVIHDYHFGGYAKHTPGLFDFMNSFYKQTSIPTDFVYTGKLLYAITDLATNNYFPDGSKILVIHSGGLQGNDSLQKGTLIY